jgi:hypothetical protein
MLQLPRAEAIQNMPVQWKAAGPLLLHLATLCTLLISPTHANQMFLLCAASARTTYISRHEENTVANALACEALAFDVAPLDRDGYCMCAIVCVKLGKDATQMVFHCSFSQSNLIGNLFIRVSKGNGA